MSQQTEKTQDPIANVENALTQSEVFIEKNKKTLLMVVGGIIVLVGGFFAYKQYVVKPMELEAQAAMFRAENYFEKDSFQLALKGKGNVEGFESIIENYGGTASANLAHYYAAVCNLQLGKYQEAIDQIDEFSGSDIMLSAMAHGIKGDALMELNKQDEAIESYLKASTTNQNTFTTPMFLMKAGLAYELKSDFAKALETYKKIKTEYPNSSEGREADKYIARAEVLMNQKGGK